MQESAILQAVHALYEGDTSYPSSTSDDYLLRREIGNAAINRWENEDGILWNELWVKLEDAADGDKTTSASTYTYNCPSDFKFPGGYVRLVDSNGDSTYYSVVPAEKIQLYDNEDKKICYFTGNPQDGYDLNFLDTHSGSLTIQYEYYKTADTMTATTSVPEMSDPYFVVYFIISKLYEHDGQNQSGLKAFQEAESRLMQMKTRNMQPTWYQDSRIEDFSMDQGVGGFGV